MTVRLTRPMLVVVAVITALAASLAVALVRPGARPAAAANDANPADVVTVVGVGTADGTPDTLTVDFTVHATRGSVQDALDAQASAARHVFAALQRSGVPRKSLQTTDLELNRHYDNHGVPTGYDASETVEARISPLAHAGRTISAGARAAGNEVEVGNMSFDVANDTSLLTSARANAYADAKARAQQYASLSQRSLGAVQKITETIESPQPINYAGADAAFAAPHRLAAVPLRVGQKTLTVRVSVTWQLS